MTEDPRRFALAELLCFPLYAASRAVSQAYAGLLAAPGLTYPQYLTLVALWEADGPVPVGELGRRLRLDSGTLTPLLKRLEGAGLVRRHRDAADERRVLVEPSARGWELREELADVPQRMLERMQIDLGDLVDLRERLDHLLDGLDRSAGRSPARDPGGRGPVSPGAPAS